MSISNIDKIRAEIERLINDLGEQRDINLEDLRDFINSLPEEPVSEDLEEAIKRAADETKLIKAKNGHPFFSEEDFNLGFSNGAQWQKKRDTKNLRAEIQRRYEYHLGCMQGSRDDTYPEISHAHHRVIKDELFEILCFLDVLENETE